MKVALAQIDTTVGDINGNASRIVQRMDAAREAGADLVVFPELAVFGYPPKDLLRRQDLIHRNVAALEQIVQTKCSVVGCVLNRFDFRESGYYSYYNKYSRYGYGYGYGYGSKSKGGTSKGDGKPKDGTRANSHVSPR